eukprot:CAMPEP_0168595044 /NCGR_PEP_ID=MMETSP0420-20121227/9233_1 /TAXON_ID=498008 /ORGANISM="Pessonella sp." /LENGTH=448 /DNA_ID=CAMNT_0008631427 /DNA_START=58 /DNA_END=1401 /DNA_ORIENTATION=+
MADDQQRVRQQLPLFLANAEWNKLLKICLSVAGVKVELEGYLNRHNKKRGWKQLMDHLRQPGAGNLADWDDLLEELGTRDVDGLTVGKFVEALDHQNVGLPSASSELKAVIQARVKPENSQEKILCIRNEVKFDVDEHGARIPLANNIFKGFHGGRPIVLKTIGKIRDGQSFHESTIIKKLNSSNNVSHFVTSSGEWQSAGEWFLLLDYYRESLDSYLFGTWRGVTTLDDRERRKREHDACVQVIEAVAYMHNLNVVHCDLALRNVLCADDHLRRVKLTDFELSHDISSERVVDPCQRDGGLEFPMPHTAPEVVRAQKNGKQQCPIGSCQSDVFGLGILLWEMLSAVEFTKSKSGFVYFFKNCDAQRQHLLANIDKREWLKVGSQSSDVAMHLPSDPTLRLYPKSNTVLDIERLFTVDGKNVFAVHPDNRPTAQQLLAQWTKHFKEKF